MRARMILAAGLMALTASFASAQTPTTFKTPLQTPVAAATVTPASGCGRGGPVVVNGSGSCAGYTSKDRTRCSLCIGGGTSNPAGCGCFASERTFLWGGCKQFFTPQQDCGKGCCGHGDRFRNKCELPTYGSGLGVPANNCAGPFSYIMR